MPQSLSEIIVQIVFSTKDRHPYLHDKPLGDMHKYLATVVRNSGCECYRVGGVADHVHIAVRLSRTITVASLIEGIKSPSSKWIKTQGSEFRDFAWQSGYGAFSVGYDGLDSLISYIDNQEEHHRTKTFQEEYLELLKRYGVKYDLRYLWE